MGAGVGRREIVVKLNTASKGGVLVHVIKLKTMIAWTL